MCLVSDQEISIQSDKSILTDVYENYCSPKQTN